LCAALSAYPETVPRATDVPVRQHLGELSQARGRGSRVQPFEVGLHVADELAGAGKDVAIEHVGRICTPGRLITAGAGRAGSVGVRGEEIPRTPQRQQELAHARADALLSDGEVSA